MGAKTKTKLTAKNADRHALYQQAVQDPEHEVTLVAKTFRRLCGRAPLTLREDFCGTALLAAHWVKGHPKRKALGVDLDAKTLAWGARHNVAPLGDEASRVTLLRQNVLDPVPGKYDVAVGLNYSYCVFRTRDELRRYFAGVRKSLVADGLFFIDIYGGTDSQTELVEPRNEGGFRYVWEQAEFNPIDNSVVNHIHFRFRDGTEMRKAFTYRWRLWQLVELTELMREAGFADARVYWEQEDEDGDGTGDFRPRRKARNDAGWNAYVVGSKQPVAQAGRGKKVLPARTGGTKKNGKAGRLPAPVATAGQPSASGLART